MFWNGWIEALHNAPAHYAAKEIAALPDDDVLHFWAWNDREAAAAIRETRESGDAAEIANIAASLRESLARDVLSEIAHRARKAGV